MPFLEKRMGEAFSRYFFCFWRSSTAELNNADFDLTQQNSALIHPKLGDEFARSRTGLRSHHLRSPGLHTRDSLLLHQPQKLLLWKALFSKWSKRHRFHQDRSFSEPFRPLKTKRVRLLSLIFGFRFYFFIFYFYPFRICDFLCWIWIFRYLSWDDYFMAIAFLSAERSKDPNRQVIIVCPYAWFAFKNLSKNRIKFSFQNNESNSQMPTKQRLPEFDETDFYKGFSAGGFCVCWLRFLGGLFFRLVHGCPNAWLAFRKLSKNQTFKSNEWLTIAYH